MGDANNVVRLWSSTCPPEREAMSDLAIASLSLGGFVLKEFIDAYFEAYSPFWWEIRRDVWLQVWSVEESTITIGETEHQVYLANRAWMTVLADCILLSECPECPDPSLVVEGFAPAVVIDFC